MKIGIDASMLVYQGSGVATYTYQLINALLTHHPEHRYHVVYSSFRRPKGFNALQEFKAKGAVIHDLPFPPRVLQLWWNKLHIIPVEIFTGKLDVYHSSDFLRPPLLPGTKGVTTIHDVTWKIYPEYHTENIVKAHEIKMQRTQKGKDMIIADSQNTKEDLMRFYNLEPGNISVIPLGVSASMYKRPNNEIRHALKKYGLPHKPFLLYVGAIEPRKNLDTCIRIFSELIKISDYKDYMFYIGGRAGWKNEYIFKLIKDLGLEKKIIFMGYVEDADLPALYCGTKCLLYLSRYEGFGLPPLEALACGSNVLAADNSSIKENVPKEFLVNISSEKDILKKLIWIIKTNPKKPAILEKYSWKNYADAFIQQLSLLSHSHAL